jgi:hypothetical protein
MEFFRLNHFMANRHHCVELCGIIHIQQGCRIAVSGGAAEDATFTPFLRAPLEQPDMLESRPRLGVGGLNCSGECPEWQMRFVPWTMPLAKVEMTSLVIKK